MQRGIIIRLYPNKEQISLLNQMFGCTRKIYNHFLDYASNNKDIVKIIKEKLNKL